MNCNKIIVKQDNLQTIYGQAYLRELPDPLFKTSVISGMAKLIRLFMIISKKIVEKVELKGKHVGSNSIHSSVKKIYKFTL